MDTPSHNPQMSTCCPRRSLSINGVCFTEKDTDHVTLPLVTPPRPGSYRGNQGRIQGWLRWAVKMGEQFEIFKCRAKNAKSMLIWRANLCMEKSNGQTPKNSTRHGCQWLVRGGGISVSGPFRSQPRITRHPCLSTQLVSCH